MGKQPSERTMRQAAKVLRGMLAQVDSGEMHAEDNPHGRRVRRRIEGAVSALEVATGAVSPPKPPTAE